MMQHIRIQRIIDANSEMSQVDLIKYKGEFEALLASIAGTIPGSRGFGLQNRYIDEPPVNIINSLVIDLADKCDEFIPAISVDQVKILGTNVSGNVSLELIINMREGVENGVS